MFARLGQGNLANYDDCYYAQKAKEMLEGGDWLTPHFAGRVRLDNPPLFLWLVTMGFRIFGVGNFGAAFFSAAAGAGSVLLLVRMARRLALDGFEAWSAGAILLTTPFFLKYSKHAMMDVPLAFLFLIAIDGYLSGHEGRRGGWVRLGVATGLGVLMKSVLGLFPLVVAVLHSLSVRRAPALREPGPWIAALVALAIAAPWFVYELAVHGEQLVAEHLRWLLYTGLVHGVTPGEANKPFVYVVGIATVYWPWLPMALGGLWLQAGAAFSSSTDDEARSAAKLMLLWIAVVIGVMSLGHSKKLWYVMSVFPALALLAAGATGRLLRSETARRRTVIGTTSVLAVFSALALLTPLHPARPRQADLTAIAAVARAKVPAGETILNLDAPYWDIASLFLFYSDHDVTAPLVDPGRVREGLALGRHALLRSQRLPDVVGEDPDGIDVVARSGEWVLVKDRKRRAALPV